LSINVSARKHRLLIGGQDWSSALLEISPWQSSPIDSSGLVKTTATITLIETKDNPGSLDDRQNNLFRTGQAITVDITNNLGTLQRHPAGALRILSAEYDYETRRLNLNCACLLTLLSYRQPTDADAAQIEPGGLVSRKDIVTRLLNAAGITNINCPYEIFYPINYPLDIGSSYIQTAGALLYSSGFVAWVNSSDESVQIKPVSLAGNPALTLQVGGDLGEEIFYRRLTNPESPREIIKVRGTKRLARIPQYPKYTTNEKYGPAASIHSSLGNYTVILEQETVAEGRNITTRTISQPQGLVLYPASSATNLIVSEISSQLQSYESGKEGKLLQTYTQTFKALGIAMTEYVKAKDEAGEPVSNQTQLIQAETVSTYYTYDAKSQLRQVTTQKSETLGAILSGTNFDWDSLSSTPDELYPSELTIETWGPGQVPQEWAHTISTSESISRIKPEALADDATVEERVALAASSSTREKSNSGQTVPPAAERRPPDAGFEDLQVWGEARFSQIGGNSYQERERVFQVDYLAGGVGSANEVDAQCAVIASLEGALLYGRFKGQDLGIELHDALFNWEPLMRVDCIEPDGTVRAFCLDDSHWYLGQERCIANFGMVWVGDRSSVTRSVSVTTTAPASSGATTLSVAALSGDIGAGTTITIAGTPVLVTATAQAGNTAISIAPLSGAIASGSSGTYAEKVLALPYSKVSDFRLVGAGEIQFTHYPYSIAPILQDCALGSGGGIFFVSIRGTTPVFGNGLLGNNNYLGNTYRLGNSQQSFVGNNVSFDNNFALENTYAL